VGSSTVNGRLNFIERWLEGAITGIKMDIDFEEGLKDLVGCVSATANTFLHLVEGVLGSMEQSLIHGPVVIFAELLDLFSRDGLNMLVKLIRANSLDKVLNGSFNFVIFAL
jgi:hypothetical protein